MTEVILRPFLASDKHWLVQQHSVQYAQDEGFDETFGPLVDDILSDFLMNHDPNFEAGWIAQEEGQPLGSIFCVRLSETTAKLRVFLLVPEARGKGLGKRMLATSTASFPALGGEPAGAVRNPAMVNRWARSGSSVNRAGLNSWKIIAKRYAKGWACCR